MKISRDISLTSRYLFLHTNTQTDQKTIPVQQTKLLKRLEESIFVRFYGRYGCQTLYVQLNDVS